MIENGLYMFDFTSGCRLIDRHRPYDVLIAGNPHTVSIVLRNMKILLIVLGALFLLWLAWGYFGSRVESPKYQLISKHEGYELRKYPAFIEARVKVTGDYREGLNQGFRRLASYIFGANQPADKIAMTAPVLESKGSKIAMTAPVAESTSDSGRWVSFVMPATYSMDLLPKPNDEGIEFVETKDRYVYVKRFSGYPTEKRVRKMKERLMRALERDGIHPESEPSAAFYNPPWTPPFMMRNEVWVNQDPSGLP